MKKPIIIDRWEYNCETYVEVRINTGEVCCVKVALNPCVVACADGNDVYSFVGGADWSLRKLTEKETAEIFEFIRKEINNTEKGE